ncbi:MAG TPA: hypothetical protein VII55_00160 [Candidatus Saccharimonadales bacterium]
MAITNHDAAPPQGQTPESQYSPPLTALLEKATYFYPGTEEYVEQLMGQGLSVADALMAPEAPQPSNRVQGDTRLSQQGLSTYYLGCLDTVAEQLSAVITLSEDPTLHTTANDWGWRLLSEARHRANRPEEEATARQAA